MNWSTVCSCSGLCAERESRARSQPQNRPRLDPGNSRQMHPRGLPTASYTYVTKMIDSTLTPRLNLACQLSMPQIRLCSSLFAVSVNCSSPTSISILHHPLSQNRKSPRNHFRSHTLPTKRSHHPRKAFHQSLYIYLIKTTTLKSILHHVFRSQNQIRNGNHYPIISYSKPTLQPRNERLLEMLQMPTHQQSSGVITLLRQLPACER